MTVYIILLGLVLLIGWFTEGSKHSIIIGKKSVNKQIMLIVSFTAMTIVLGLRGQNVGEDTRHYLHIFEQSKSVTWNDMLHSTGMRTAYFTDQYGYTDTIENGFLILCKIVHWFTDIGQVFLFVVAALTCFFFAKFIFDNCEKVFFSTYIFLCESMFMFAFNGIRQLLAGAIAIQAYTLLKKRKIKSAVIVILLGALIHNVALICFALFPIMLTKPQKESKRFKYMIIATVVAPFVIMVASSVIIAVFPRYTAYFTVNYWTNSLGGIAILWFIEFLLIIHVYCKKFIVKGSYNLSSLVLLYLACELMGLQITMFSRVGLFFRPALMLFYPNVENYFSKKKRFFIRAVIMILLALLFLSYARTPFREYSFCL